MSFIVQIQEIVSGPIRDLYVEFTAGLPVINIPPLGSSFGDISVDLGSSGLGSTFGDANLGSTDFGSSDFGSSFGSSNGDQNLGSSGLQLPNLPTLGS
ncbi:MAG: hypothetical protein ACTH2Y_08525 [Corynebacterium sp.]|uniref:hypothetical protein n=1 Tax=unclassified Corynebacterium TaxID=2624378 RepID=UPI002647B615|nr:hypothetical protein [Corynebacterium sp.]MDN5581007.1 hypothetical protein [Corynebacterium sp.]MDN5719757.1 hypothetical protein [Corynebacterium sp.]MDN6386284.1 hypothetical protein [Corynebacterium sp.]MDN6510828.1 hypothetical protein [Corynebacterium sp.]